MTEGLRAFITKINTNQMTPETFTHLLICFKCYKYEQHATKDCTETEIKCSECAQTGHTFQNCTNTTKRCLNCPTNDNFHRTLAAKCPYRKKTIDNKNRQQNEKQTTEQNKTYAAIAQAAIKQTLPQSKISTPKITLTNKTHLKLTALILEAHIASLHCPQQYGKILSQSLKDNFDIDATFPDRDSGKIFNFYYNQEKNDESDMDDDPFIDDNDFRRSSLNLSNQQTEPPVTTETEKRPRTDEDEFKKPTKSARRRRNSDRTRKASPSSRHSADGRYWRRQDFEDQQTPDPGTAQAKPQNPPTNKQIHDLEQNWTQERITANLPPTSGPLIPTQKQTLRADELGLKLYKNKNDDSPLPNTLDKIYLERALNTNDKTTGIKITAPHSENLKMIFSMLIQGFIVVKSRHIHHIPPDEFYNLPRISHSGSTNL